MSTDLIVGMTLEDVDRYLDILEEKNKLSREWLELEKAKRHTQRGDKTEAPREIGLTPEAPPPSKQLGLTAEQAKLLYTGDDGQTYVPIKFLGKDTWIEINGAMKAAGYRWISKGKDTYWERVA